MEARYQIDGFNDSCRRQKRVSASSADVVKLDIYLFVVVVHPTTVDIDVYTVESNDAVRCEEAVHEQTNDTTYGMLRKEIKCIVDLEEEFDFRERSDNKSTRLTRSYVWLRNCKLHQ